MEVNMDTLRFTTETDIRKMIQVSNKDPSKFYDALGREINVGDVCAHITNKSMKISITPRIIKNLRKTGTYVVQDEIQFEESNRWCSPHKVVLIR